MSVSIFAVDCSGNPVSGFLNGIANRRISLALSSDAPHPIAAQSVLMRRLASGLDTFLDMLEPAMASSRTVDKTHKGDEELADQFRQVIYRVTEVFDFYVKIPDVLGAQRVRSLREASQNYRAALKRRRDHWAQICNKLKHSVNEMVPVNMNHLPFGPLVLGFGVISYQGGMWAPNKEIHPKKKPLSYACELHQIAADILKCDAAAGQLATLLNEDEQLAPVGPPHDFGLSVGTAFKKIASLQAIGMYERRTQDTITWTDEGILVERRILEVPLCNNAHVQILYKGDGYTKTFQVF